MQPASRTAWIERRLDELLPVPATSGVGVRGAMRYATLGAGKRLRPVLALTCVEALGGDPWAAMDSGCAIEMIHCASLILDDLPCMDDALLRRHRPTVHRVFGENVAVLASIGLLSHAVAVAASDRRIPPGARAQIAAVIGRSVGCDGLVGGQEMDLRPSTLRPSVEAAVDCNRRKTGALFEAAADVAAIVCSVSKPARRLLQDYGRAFGCALQARDDVDDATMTPAVLGKDVGQDKGRHTLAQLKGSHGAVNAVQRHLEEGRMAVERLAALRGCRRPELLLRLLDHVFADGFGPARSAGVLDASRRA